MTRDDLDNYVKEKEPILGKLTAYATLRDTYWKVVQAEYATELRTAKNPFVIGSTFTMAVPPATGTEEVNTTLGDVFIVALDPTHDGIAGDTILVADPAAYFKSCPRTTIELVTIGGAEETILGFIEAKGEIFIYAKEAEFTAPADVHYYFWRILDASLPLGATVLDILEADFTRLADRLTELMLIGIN